MNKFLSFLVAVIFSIVSISPTELRATPISIDFTFDSFDASFNGTVQSTGDFSMRLLVDTETANLGTGFGNFQNFYAVDAFITAANLGLNNTKIVSDTFLYFGSSVVGIADMSSGSGFSNILTAFIGPNLQFGTEWDLSTLIIPQGPITKTGTEWRTARGWQFENGSQFDGVGETTAFTNENNTVSVSALAPVPLPAAFPLLLAALGGLGFAARRRKDA